MKPEKRDTEGDLRIITQIVKSIKENLVKEKELIQNDISSLQAYYEEHMSLYESRLSRVVELVDKIHTLKGDTQ